MDPNLKCLLAYVEDGWARSEFSKFLKRVGLDDTIFEGTRRLDPRFYKVLIPNPAGGRRIHDDTFCIDIELFATRRDGESMPLYLSRLQSCVGGSIPKQDAWEIKWLYQMEPEVVDEESFDEVDDALVTVMLDDVRDESESGVSYWSAVVETVDFCANSFNIYEEIVVHDDEINDYDQYGPVVAHVTFEFPRTLEFITCSEDVHIGTQNKDFRSQGREMVGCSVDVSRRVCSKLCLPGKRVCAHCYYDWVEKDGGGLDDRVFTVSIIDVERIAEIGTFQFGAALIMLPDEGDGWAIYVPPDLRHMLCMMKFDWGPNVIGPLDNATISKIGRFGRLLDESSDCESEIEYSAVSRCSEDDERDAWDEQVEEWRLQREYEGFGDPYDRDVYDEYYGDDFIGAYNSNSESGDVYGDPPDEEVDEDGNYQMPPLVYVRHDEDDDSGD